MTATVKRTLGRPSKGLAQLNIQRNKGTMSQIQIRNKRRQGLFKAKISQNAFGRKKFCNLPIKLIDCDSTFVKIVSTDFNFEVFFS